MDRVGRRWLCASFALPSILGVVRGAEGEEALVHGMGRTVGWIVAADDGELAFRDCRGRVSPLADGRLEATTRHCAGTGPGIEVSGVVRGVDLARGLLVVEDGGGDLRRFYIDLGRTDRPALSELAPGDAVRVTGPVAGRASGISRP